MPSPPDEAGRESGGPGVTPHHYGATEVVVAPETAGVVHHQVALPPATLDVSIVVPYYNPGTRLRHTVDQMLQVLRDSEASFEIITVSDGSTDGSPLSLEGLPDDVIRNVVLERNGGKGQALQVGLALGRGRYLGFLDADGDLSPSLLAPFLTLMRLYEPDIILGSKRHPMSSVHYPPVRRAYSWGYQQLIRVLFNLQVRDTQVGIKLIDREVIAAVLPLLVERRFAFDLELLVVANHLGYDKLFEAPVRIEERFSSTISSRAVLGMLADTLSIFVRLRMLRFYDKKAIPSIAGTLSVSGPEAPGSS
jgi:glycosyltransferase involved in cell wall biosynthesis